MKKNRLTIAMLLVVVMLFGMIATAFAKSYTPVDPDDQGKTGIVGGDSLTFSEDTVWASLTARWGVRVIFQDGNEWNNAELKNELLPVTDSSNANTNAPETPSHEGYGFIGWERVDKNNGPSTLNSDGSVTGINGPGPIIYRAMYEPKVGSLTVSKTVTGTAGDTEKAFTFTVTFGDSGKYRYTGSASGTISSGDAVQLKHGESITISGIPTGTSYMVAESDNEGYEVSKNGDTGTIATNSTATAAFTNRKDADKPSTPTEPYSSHADPNEPGTSDKASEAATPNTGDGSNMGLWISLFLASFIGIGVCFVLFRKNRRVGKHIRMMLLMLMVGVMAFSNFGATNVFAAGNDVAEYIYGQYDMTYLPGTTDAVANMPSNETGLIPGNNNPYKVSSTVPQREGFEFIDWTLNWGTMEKPMTSYVVKYLDKDTGDILADEKVVDGQVGSEVTETAIDIEGYNAIEPTIVTIELQESDNVITFYYEKNPVQTSYVVRHFDIDTGMCLAVSRHMGVVGTCVTVTAIDIEGYNAIEPTSVTIELKPEESGNVIIFYYKKESVLTSYTVRYLEEGTNKPLAAEKVMRDQVVGSEVTETAIDIEGYNAIDPTSVKLELKESDNVITFYYKKKSVPVLFTSYDVRYLEKGTNEPLAAGKVVLNQLVGSEVTETAIDIEGYNAIDPTSVKLILEESGNVITFYYKKNVVQTSYIVRYLDEDTNQSLADDKVVTGCAFGEMVEETAIEIEGYVAVAPTSVELVVGDNAATIVFYYKKLVDYTVHYMDYYGNVLADSKIVRNLPVGTVITERHINIDGYVSRYDTITFRLQSSDNECFFYYEPVPPPPPF